MIMLQKNIHSVEPLTGCTGPICHLPSPTLGPSLPGPNVSPLEVFQHQHHHGWTSSFFRNHRSTRPRLQAALLGLDTEQQDEECSAY